MESARKYDPEPGVESGCCVGGWMCGCVESNPRVQTVYTYILFMMLYGILENNWFSVKVCMRKKDLRYTDCFIYSPPSFSLRPSG